MRCGAAGVSVLGVVGKAVVGEKMDVAGAEGGWAWRVSGVRGGAE